MYKEAIEDEMRKIMKDHKLTGFEVEEAPRGFTITVRKNEKAMFYPIFDHNLKNSINIGAVVRERFNANAYGWATQVSE